MRGILLTCAITLVLCNAADDYQDLDDTSSIEVKEYGTQAAKDIRAIGRSYAYNLMNKQNFTKYATDVYEMFTGDDTKTGQDAMVEGIEKYTKEYKPHVVVVGLGIILAILLFVGFFFTCCCILCCNRSQKTTTTMAMWRMIWGSLLVILLAANIAGIAILVVSGQQMLTMGSDTNETLDVLGDGFVDYLGDTNTQINQIKDKRFPILLEKLGPLVEDVTNATSKAVKTSTDPDFDATVTGIVSALNGLDGTLTTASTSIGTIGTEITNMEGYVSTINANLKACAKTIQDCDTAGHSCSAAIPVNNFDTAFDSAELKSGDVQTIKNTIDSLATVDGKTIAEWASFVKEQWDTLETFIFKQSLGARTSYTETLTKAETTFKDKMQNDVQVQLTDAQSTIIKQKNETKAKLYGTFATIKDNIMGKTSNYDSYVPDSIKDMAILRHVMLGITALVGLLAVLLVLTVIVGLLSTILGCCQVDDELLPTQRKSGCCGNLLMCTSYCSVILCAIATLVSALLVSVVMVQEGICKQHDDQALFAGIDSLIAKFSDKNITEMVAEELNVTLTVSIDDIMTSCKDNKTLITALKIDKNTEISGFSINSVEKEIDSQIDAFDVEDTIKDLSFDGFDLMDDATKKKIEDQQTDLKTKFDYATVKSYLESTQTSKLDFTTITTKLDDLATTLNTAGQTALGTEVTSCKTKVLEIETLTKETSPVGAFPTSKDNLVTELDTMSGVADSASTHISSLVSNIAKLETDLFTEDAVTKESYIKKKLIESVTSGIDNAKNDVTVFVNFIFEQFQTTVLKCQPAYATVETSLNYACDGIFIHLTLLYCSLSLISLSLLFYMCVSRCMARYFIRYSNLHPDDEGAGGNGWAPTDNYYAQTKF